MQTVAGTKSACGIPYQRRGAMKGGGPHGQQLQVIRALTLEALPRGIGRRHVDLAGSLLDGSALANSVTHHVAATRSSVQAACQRAAAALPLSFRCSATSTLVSTYTINMDRRAALRP